MTIIYISPFSMWFCPNWHIQVPPKYTLPFYSLIKCFGSISCCINANHKKLHFLGHYWFWSFVMSCQLFISSSILHVILPNKMSLLFTDNGNAGTILWNITFTFIYFSTIKFLVGWYKCCTTIRKFNFRFFKVVIKNGHFYLLIIVMLVPFYEI